MRVYDTLHTDGSWRLDRHTDNWREIWPHVEYVLHHECDNSAPFAIRYPGKHTAGETIQQGELAFPCAYCGSVAPAGLQGMCLTLAVL